MVQGALALQVVAFVISTLPGVRGSPGFEPLLDGWLQGSAYVTAAVLVALRPAMSGSDRSAWTWVAAGLVARAIGFVLFLAVVREMDPRPYPSGADVAWLAMPVLLLVGLALLARPRIASVSLRIALDGVAGALVCAGVSVAFMYGTLLALTAPGVPTSVVVTNMAYPLSDLMLLIAVVGLFIAFAWRPGRSIWILCVAVLGFAVVDWVFLYQVTEGTFRPGTLVSALSLVATSLMANAAWMPERESRIALPTVPSGVALPATIILTCVALLVYKTQQPVPLSAVLLTAAAAVVAVGRGVMTFQDVSGLTRKLGEQTAALHRSEEAAHVEAQRLAALLNGMTDYAILAGGSRGLTFFSPGAERMLGYSAAEVVGAKEPPVFWDQDEAETRARELGVWPPVEAFMALPRDGTPETREWTYIRRDGSRFPVTLTVTALTSKTGDRTEFLAVARDVSTEHRVRRYRSARDDLAKVLSEASSVEQALPKALSTIVDGIGWDIGVIWVPEAGKLRCAALWEAPHLEIPGFREHVESLSMGPGENLAGRVWQSGESLWIDDLRTFAGLTEKAAKLRDADLAARLRTVVAVPVRATEEGRVTGVLQVIAEQPGLQDDHLLTLMEATATTLGRSIERERISWELRSALDEATHANRANGEFVSRASHELRTPLNAVLGFAQLLDHDLEDPRQRERTAQIISAGNHLVSLIDDLLDLGKVERGELRVSVEAVSATEVITAVLELAHPLIVERQLDLDIDAHEGIHVFVLADFQRLRQVLLNLVSNAVKYNRRGGRIKVSFALPEPGVLRFLIADTGTGIAEDDLPRLFRPFERLDAEHGSIQGTGLGLAVSKGLVKAMGGHIGVRSAPGEGSTFHVDLPITDAPSVLLAPNTGGVQPAWLDDGDLRGTVLYIEDNPANVKLVEEIFAARPGVRLLTAMQGSLGLELADRHQPDLVLLDAQLPDLDGELVLERLKSDSTTASIPVLVISADAAEHRRRGFLQRGAEYYLTKPFNIRVFRELVGGLLTSRAPDVSGSRMDGVDDGR